MLESTQVIAIDQDPLSEQRTLLSQSGLGQVWVKPLDGGARAVARFNRGPSTVQISTTGTAIGLPPASRHLRYFIQDLWSGQANTTKGAITALVPSHGAALYYATTDKLPPKRPKPRSKRKERPRQRREIASRPGATPRP